MNDADHPTRKPEPFPDTLYPHWCKAWIHVVGAHSQRLADWLGSQSQPAVAAAIRVDWAKLGSTLPQLVADLDQGIADPAALARAYGCLRELELRHRGESRRWFAPPPRIATDCGSYVLAPPMRHTARPHDRNGGSFKRSGQLAIAGTLGLEYCWIPLQANDWRSGRAPPGGC
jgi:hypothetical protein